MTGDRFLSADVIGRQKQPNFIDRLTSPEECLHFCTLQLMKMIGNENANKLLEWSIHGDDMIDSDADE